MNSNSNEMYEDEIDSNEGHEVHLGFNNSADKMEEEKATTENSRRYNTRASRAANRGLKRGNKLLEKSNEKSKAEMGYNTTNPSFD